MKGYEATAAMHEIVDRYVEDFEKLGLIVSKEEFYSNAMLAPTSPESARFINVTLVLRTRESDDEEAGAEHRIGIGVNVKRKNVTDEELSMAEAEFCRRVKEALDALLAADDVEAAVVELDRAATEEYERIANEYKKSLPKKIIALIAIIVIAAAIMILVANM